jgi:hypothetical protein
MEDKRRPAPRVGAAVQRASSDPVAAGWFMALLCCLTGYQPHVQEEDISDEEADSAGPVKWVVPAWEVLAHDRAGWRGGLKSLRVNECE